MPIRLNLLAEAQAAEEMRRKDPVKRVVWGGVLLVAGMLVWSSSLYVQAVINRSSIRQDEAAIASRTNEYTSVIEAQHSLNETTRKLAALHQLATNRFLHGTLLNELQQTTLDDIRLTHLRVDQNYVLTAEVKAKTTGSRKVPGKPATATERIMITLEGRDFSSNPGDQINQLKEVLATNAYFHAGLGRNNEVLLKKLSPIQGVPGQPPYVAFTLECPFQERTR